MNRLPQNQYIPIVDSLRGGAATAVCFYHFIWGTVDYIKTPWVRDISYWGQYGVTLFFVLSGIVLPLALLRHKYQIHYWGAFLWRRFWRLEPPYLLSIIITVGYLFLKAWRHQEVLMVSSWNLLLHLGYFIPFVEDETWVNPVYWSLAVEFQYYFLLGIIFPLWTSSKTVVRYTIYLSIFTLSMYSNQKDLIFRWLPLFLVSGNYILYRQAYIKSVEFFFILITGSIFLGHALGAPHSIVMLGTLILVHFFPCYNPKWSAWLGRCSYSLYLLHWPIGQALINVLSHHYRLPYQKILVILLGYGSSVLVATFFYYWIEKPSQHKATKIGYGRRVVKSKD